MTRLPSPPPAGDPAASAAWVAEHLGDLTLEGPGGVRASPRFRGGQAAADAALALFDVAGYASRRNQVWPEDRRGASALSPYVRYGLLPLRRLWDHVGDGPAKDRGKYRDELLWQEHARHLFARLGHATRQPLRFAPAEGSPRWDDPWPREMACMDAVAGELERDGWIVNQTRMWLSSQFTVRAGHPWPEGEDRFFTHLLDGNRGPNRLGWQWSVGAATGRPYGFSRWQVEKRAPGLCARCPLRDACPVQEFPDAAAGPRVEPDPRLREDPDPAATAGPVRVQARRPPRSVWLTGESMGDADPALAAHPELPAVWVFDEPLLARWRLSGKRLVLLAETLGEIAAGRELEVHRGAVPDVLAGRDPAVTFAPVPGFRRRAAALEPAEVHPWPWLVRPTGREPLSSFSAWVRKVPRPGRAAAAR